MDKYEWSEHGLLMLQDIENSIRSYGGRNKVLLFMQNEHHKGYSCTKSDCDYCERLHLKLNPEKEITFRKKYKRIDRLSTYSFDPKNSVKADNSFNY
jgi:hypothetical protein